MSLRLSPERERAVSSALRNVADLAATAAAATELREARRALNEVWFAIHGAHQAIDRAETEQRAAWLARLEGEAA